MFEKRVVVTLAFGVSTTARICAVCVVSRDTHLDSEFADFAWASAALVGATSRPPGRRQHSSQ